MQWSAIRHRKTVRTRANIIQNASDVRSGQVAWREFSHTRPGHQWHAWWCKLFRFFEMLRWHDKTEMLQSCQHFGRMHRLTPSKIMQGGLFMLCRAALASWAGFGYYARARSVAACSRKGVNISSCVRGGGVCLERSYLSCILYSIPGGRCYISTWRSKVSSFWTFDKSLLTSCKKWRSKLTQFASSLFWALYLLSLFFCPTAFCIFFCFAIDLGRAAARDLRGCHAPTGIGPLTWGHKNRVSVINWECNGHY